MSVQSDFKKAMAECVKLQKTKKRAEMGLFLNTHFPFSYHGYQHFIYTAVRGIGKSVISVETVIQLKRKYGYENVKAFYFRLKDDSVKAMLANNAEKAVDPLLIHKYNLKISVKGNKVLDDGKTLLEFYPLVSAGSKGKGVNLYDCDYLPSYFKDGKKRFIITIWDEFLLAEGVEKKSVGDPVAQYRIYMEAVLRDAQRMPYDAVKCFYLANSVSECASVTGALFNYIPDPNNHKRVKLTRKHAVFWNVPVTDKYKKRRGDSYMSDIINFENDINYNNKVKRDLSLIKPRKTQIRRVTELIKFDKYDMDKWFCLYDGKYLRKYRGESVAKNVVRPMRRYLDEMFDQDYVNSVIERYDLRFFHYTDIMSQALFTAQMKLIKAK